MPNQITAIARYTLLEALRNRIAWLIVAAILASAALSFIVAPAAVSEGRDLQVALLGALLRACAAFVAAATIITTMVREHQEKGAEFLLSLPMPRAAYLLGKLAGFLGGAVCLAVLTAAPLALLAPASGAGIWAASLACELWIVSAFALFCAVTLTNGVAALGTTLGFYVLARSVSALQLIAAGPLAESTFTHEAMTLVVSAIGFLLPDMAMYTRTAWLLHGPVAASDLLPLLAQTLIYVGLLASAALFDLYRRSL